MSNRIVKVLLLDKEGNAVIVNGKGFLEVNVTAADIRAAQSARGAFPTVPLSSLLSSTSTPSVLITEDDKSNADIIAVENKLIELLTVYGSAEKYRVDSKKFKEIGLTDPGSSRFVHIVAYTLDDREKETIKTNSSRSGLSFVFTPLGALPVGLTGVDAGMAYWMTRNYDFIRDRLFLNVPSLYLPSRVPVFNPIGAFPLFSPYSLPSVVDYRSRYNSYRPENIFDAPPIPRSHSRGRSLGRSPRSSRSSSRSSRGSRGSRGSRVGRSSSPGRRYREKYLKYKMKYIQLKQMMGDE